MAGAGASRADPSYTCIVGGARKEHAVNARPCCARCACVACRTAMGLGCCYQSTSLLLWHRPSPRAYTSYTYTSSSAMSIRGLSRSKQASKHPWASSTFSCGPAITCCATYHTLRLGSSHTRSAHAPLLVSAVSAGDRWEPSGMVLPWQVLACAYEAVRGTEKKQVRNNCQRQFSCADQRILVAVGASLANGCLAVNMSLQGLLRTLAFGGGIVRSEETFACLRVCRSWGLSLTLKIGLLCHCPVTTACRNHRTVHPASPILPFPYSRIQPHA